MMDWACKQFRSIKVVLSGVYLSVDLELRVLHFDLPLNSVGSVVQWLARRICPGVCRVDPKNSPFCNSFGKANCIYFLKSTRLQIVTRQEAVELY